ncbi:hypothetical protein Tco_1473187 [Tanacetum coccineum]
MPFVLMPVAAWLIHFLFALILVVDRLAVSIVLQVPAARSVGHGIGGAGKDIVGFLKIVSRMKSGLFNVLPVLKWNWNV